MDTVDPFRILFSFLLVIGLIGLCAGVLKWYLKKNPGGLPFQKDGVRLKVLETRMIDAKRKLVLIQRDEQEHLLLLSPNSETLIEKIEKQK